jgi:hypothetical protein
MPIPGVVASGHHVASNNAVRFSASTMKYTRSATGLAGTFTWTCWVKVVVDRNAFSIAMSQDNAGGNYYFMGTNATGTQIIRDSTSGGAANPGVDMTVGNWYYIGSVNDTGAGTDIFGAKPAGGAWTTAVLGSGVTATGPSDANTLHIGGDGFGDFLNGSVAAVKIWTVALTDAELQAEAATYAPVKTSGLWASYSFRNGLQTTDDSGNGRTLTQVGTPVLDSAGPPIT